MNVFRCCLPLALSGLLLSGAVSAEPRFAQMYRQQFGYTPGCNACHKDGGGTPLNAYGEAFKEAGSGLGAFARIARGDADGDGASNADEAVAKANPGSARSKPDATGDWLSTANLIPRAVRDLYPDVTAYKPLDAILTDSEIKRARAMGVELAKQDETTIYVPVRSRKAIGTAVIVPGAFRGETFFVVLATDRQLKVTHAAPMHVGKVEGADSPGLYRAAIGRSVQDLPAGGDDNLRQAVAAALKKAGTLLYVRLKRD